MANFKLVTLQPYELVKEAWENDLPFDTKTIVYHGEGKDKGKTVIETDSLNTILNLGIMIGLIKMSNEVIKQKR